MIFKWHGLDLIFQFQNKHEILSWTDIQNFLYQNFLRRGFAGVELQFKVEFIQHQLWKLSQQLFTNLDSK